MNFIINQKIKEREEFFADNYIKNYADAKKISIVAVVHLIDTGIPYVNSLEKYFSLQYIIPKPSSIDKKLLDFYPKDKILNITRDELKNPENIIKHLADVPKDNKLLLLDIGGYFVHSINDLKKTFGDRFIGVIEDTENGHQKYLSLQNLDVPIVSVARSPLKNNEDHLVGQAVVFSVDLILREQGILLNNKRVGVLGFGKIGNGILSSLRDKGCAVSVYDRNPVTIILALSKGFAISDKLKILDESDIIFCSTGNLSLKNDEFKYLKNGAFVASVTSSDDELDLSWLKENYTKETISDYIDKYDKNGHYFYLLNDGNAINFIHGAVIGDFILLVQKEMIDTIIFMDINKLEKGVQDSYDLVRQRVAKSWLKYFLKIEV
ncbi:MAG: adenosylhomocysteinase [bacterium]|nr:adenosylhomocysteinase [bacterium]